MPGEIDLVDDCTVLNVRAIPGVFLGLYGFGNEGGAEAANYARANQLGCSWIDVVVKLDHSPRPDTIRPEQVPDIDFLSIKTRASRSLRDEFAEVLKQSLEQEEKDASAYNTDESRPYFVQELLGERPDLITKIINLPAYNHLKVIVFPVKTRLREKPFSIAAIPFRHLACIQQAKCRVHPKTKIIMPSSHGLQGDGVIGCSLSKFPPPP